MSFFRVAARHRLPLALASLLLLLSLQLQLQQAPQLQGGGAREQSKGDLVQREEDRESERDDAALLEPGEAMVAVALGVAPAPRPPRPPPTPPSALGVWNKLQEIWRLSSNIRTEHGVVDIKPLVNLTINTFGLLEGAETGPADSSNSQLVMKSLFNIWNPQASAWATNKSREFKTYVRSEGHFGDKGHQGQASQELEVELGPCGCNRTLAVDPVRFGSEDMSTCSRETFLRGAGQKVIGFSFYDNPNSTKATERKYFQGIEENVSLLSLHYPGWLVRLYYDLQPGQPTMDSLCRLACSQPSLDLCHVRSLPSSGDVSRIFPMNWRFLPVLDPQVSAFLSRDLDSRINSREAAAVSAWLATPHHFHFMRDHPAHFIEVLGSGWGVRMGPQDSQVRRLLTESFKQAAKDPMFWADRKAYGPDQGFLKRYLWPWAKWSSTSHDSFSCQRFPRTSAFPTRRKEGENNFVAAVVLSRDILRKECPPACRPPEHPDWIRC